MLIFKNERVIIITTCRWHKGEQDLPEEGQEVEDVITAGRHLLFTLIPVFIII